MPRSPHLALALTLSAVLSLVVSREGAAQARAGEPPPDRIDYLTFAQGAIPVAIEGAGAKLGATFEHAVRMIDGDPTGFTFVNNAGADTDTIFVYELPALTTFDRLAVPNIRETPSPSQTFSRIVEVHGSSVGPGAGYTLLGSAALVTHAAAGQVTEIPVVARTPVRWVRLRLVGGTQVMRPQSFFEFSEIIGNGTQEVPARVDRFHGVWNGTGVVLDLKQAGAVVSGCYDRTGDLTGTVTGNILRATGTDRSDGTKSAFILSVTSSGAVRGVRSTNGAPFRLYTGPQAAAGVKVPCGDPAPPVLGCGSVIHGITFDFDSATIRPDSTDVLANLFKGLQSDTRAKIVIEGHTSNEGSDTYNQRLSERRAQAVVADLVRRGLATARVSAVGIGEARPIATNTDESGRSLNRRVEVKCQ